jgi:hypothetical protein
MRISYCLRRWAGRRTARVRRFVVAAVVALGLVRPAPATVVPRLPLDRIVRAADRIVYGTVTDVRSGRDEAGLTATWVTLAVSRAVKGHVGAQLTLKQYGAATPLADGTVTRVAGLPRYQVGDEVVLFLHPDSRRGFTSPVGFAQGAYRVSRRGGRARVHADGVRGHEQDLDAFLSDLQQVVGRP